MKKLISTLSPRIRPNFSPNKLRYAHESAFYRDMQHHMKNNLPKLIFPNVEIIKDPPKSVYLS